jgi:prevent-host-death family protein
MGAESIPESWTVTQAKARLSEVIDKARREGPQAITRNGKRVVVVVVADWERLQKRQHQGSLADFLINSPLRESGLESSRVGEGVHDIGLRHIFSIPNVVSEAVKPRPDQG